jgi:tetratricopeptide (TPR) repeat protein
MSGVQVRHFAIRVRSAGIVVALLMLLVAAVAHAGDAGLEASAPGGAILASAQADGSREARLQQALDRYARALTETDRDARLADFARAERAFATLAGDGVETPSLWTNLGNAALQAQHPGQAVLAYHRALALDPDDTKARQNLNHVRSGLPPWVPHPDSTEGAQSLSLSQFAEATRTRVAAFLFLAMAVFVAASIRRSEGAWRGLAMLAGIGWVVVLGSTMLEDGESRKRLAVTTADESFARSADSALSSLAYPEPLPPGVEVDALEERAGWVRARLANGRDVWLRGSSVTLVAPRQD